MCTTRYSEEHTQRQLVRDLLDRAFGVLLEARDAGTQHQACDIGRAD